RQRGLAMVDVTDRAYVHVRLSAFKFLFRHFSISSLGRNQIISVGLFLVIRAQEFFLFDQAVRKHPAFELSVPRLKPGTEIFKIPVPLPKISDAVLAFLR